MGVAWLSLSNPVAVWWGFLLIVSSINVTLWLLLKNYLRRRALQVELIVIVSAVYVFGCAFRAVLPRADVQRICLFDTWLSSVALGRSIATIAEICFVIQWAIVVHHVAKVARSNLARTVSNAIVPLIVIAECCSWHAVITTNYLGNTIENSLWALTFLLIAATLLLLLPKFERAAQLVMGAMVLGIVAYVLFMFTVDVPMYFERWQADLASGKQFFEFLPGLHDAHSRWVVTHDLAQWKDEIAWMSLYFSMAVWASLALCGIVLIKDRLAHYRTSPVSSRSDRARLFAGVR